MNSYDEDRSIYNAQYEVAVIIDRPVRDVWNQFLDIGSWVTSHKIEEVQGQRGTVGGITRVSSHLAKDSGYPPPHYHFCKIVKVVPEEQYVLKTYSERGGSYGMQMTGFDDSRFTALSERTTRLTFNLMIEFKCDKAAEEPASMDALMEGSRQGMIENYLNLKRIVESESGRS
jgi:hypothetical protein